jgi:type IV pilus assembly protein PilN
MFTIDINFLKDRQGAEGAGEAQPIADVNWLIGGGVVAFVLVASTLGAYFYYNSESQKLQKELDQLAVQEKQLDNEIADIKAKEAEITKIDQQTQKLLTLFVGDVPSSAILQDIRERTPPNVKIESFTQLDKKITIQGQAAAANEKASAFDQINDFMLKLQESPFLAANGVELKSSKLLAPQKDVDVDIAQYQLELTLTPQTALDLEQELQRAQSEGIISRIAVLKEKGVQVGTPAQPEGGTKQ